MIKLAQVLLFILLYTPIIYGQSENKVKSIINIPFHLSLSSLGETIDESLGIVLYKDSLLTDNDNDQLQTVISKSGPLKLSSISNNILKVDIPLKIWIKKGIGAMGYYNYNSTSFEMMLSFKIAYNIMSNWTLKTKTYANGYTWIEKPSMSIGGLSIPLTTIVGTILNHKQKDIAIEIDNQIGNHVAIKEDIIKLWNQMSQPTLISDTPLTWLLLTPISILATPFLQNSKEIYTQIGIEINSETFVWTSPLAIHQVRDIPNLKYMSSLPQDFQLYTQVYVPIEVASKMANEQMAYQEFDFQGGKKVTVKDISLSKIEDNLNIRCNLNGSYRGVVNLTGMLFYDSTTMSIKMKNLDFDYKTKNIFHKSATWLFNGIIEKKLAQNIKIPLKDMLKSSRVSTESALNIRNQKIKSYCKILAMYPKSIYLKDSTILVSILTQGELVVSY